MSPIQKITVRYDEQQDRLHLFCEDAAGGVAALWLTQRLANRLVRTLVAQLEGDAPAPAMNEMVQAWRQSAAMAQHVAAPPVEAGPEIAPRLVHSIDMTLLPGGLQLAFRAMDDAPVVFTLDATVLRQWLAIVHQRYRDAEWPCDGIWPAWFDGAGADAAAPPAGAVRH